MQVQGKQRFFEGQGVRTRRQAAVQGPSSTKALVPLPLKLMHVLVQLLQEAEASSSEGKQDWRHLLFGDADEWETEDDDDEEAHGKEAHMAAAGIVGIESVVRASLPLARPLAHRPCQHCCGGITDYNNVHLHSRQSTRTLGTGTLWFYKTELVHTATQRYDHPSAHFRRRARLHVRAQPCLAASHK